MNSGSSRAVDLNNEQEALWNSALDESENYAKDGDMEASYRSALKAWDVLPEPKLLCSYAYITAMAVAKASLASRKFEEGVRFVEWFSANTPREKEVSVFFVQKGILLFESGDVSGALEAFRAAWKKAKKFPFLGEDKKYLQFLVDKS